MKKNIKKQIIYYDDELNNEFSTAEISAKKIDDDYVYIHKSFFKKITHFFWYRIVALPIAWFYLKIHHRHKIENRKILKKFRKEGYFLFGNHTQQIADALIPTFVAFPKDVYVIVHPNNVSMPYLGRVTPSMGALPLPDTLGANKRFVKAISQRLDEGHVITIYPEAHIWPYYTKIRPFSDQSFYYPIRQSRPVFCFTNTYQKARFRSRPRLVTYVDGPFYPSSELKGAEQRSELRDRVYECMVNRSKSSEVEYIEYRRKGESR